MNDYSKPIISKQEKEFIDLYLDGEYHADENDVYNKENENAQESNKTKLPVVKIYRSKSLKFFIN